MAAWVEPTEPGWAPRQMLMTALRKLGYAVTPVGIGDSWKLWLSTPVR